jgi:hypothetical protein
MFHVKKNDSATKRVVPLEPSRRAVDFKHFIQRKRTLGDAKMYRAALKMP